MCRMEKVGWGGFLSRGFSIIEGGGFEINSCNYFSYWRGDRRWIGNR